MTFRSFLQLVAVFFRNLWRKLLGRPLQDADYETAHYEREAEKLAIQQGRLTEQSPAPKRKMTQRERRRIELRGLLHRTDGGGKHYGSKRAGSNHRTSGHGKRSGRQ